MCRLSSALANYKRRFEAAKALAIRQRFLLPEDADAVELVPRPEDLRDPPSQAGHR